MVLMKINACASGDRRIKTQRYAHEKGPRFSLAEGTLVGTLITDFSEDGEVLGQAHFKSKDTQTLLASHLSGVGELNVTCEEPYEHIQVNAVCTKCGKREIARELDLRKPEEIDKIPVVPMFVCKGCKSRFYSMTDSYLMQLVKSNSDLFEASELKERELNEKAFFETLQAYIIRIFASKKISRLTTRG